MKYRFNHLMALVTLAVTIALAPAARAAEPPIACPGGLCSGLGHAFYLPDRNVLDAKDQSSGRQILTDTQIGRCATVTKSGASNRGFEQFDSTKSVTNAWSTKFGIGNESQGATIPLGSGFSLGGTASTTMSRSLTTNESFNSLNLFYYLLDSLVDLNRNSECWSVANLDPAFLANFEALPLSDPKNAAEGSTWSDYTAFLKSWGSHVQVKQELGSRFSIWQTETASDKLTMKTLEAKTCFSIGGAGVTLPLCGNYNDSEKLSASQNKTVEKTYISGGSNEARNALLVASPKSEEYQAKLTAFIASAANSDQAVGFQYVPIWGLLTDVYRTQCGTDGKDSKACNNLQRAVTLQAAFEGYLSYNCVKNAASSGALFVQGMKAGPANGNGIYYYSCHQAKTGCHTDNDCQLASGDDSWVPFAGNWEQCFCAGAGCLTPELIPGTGQYRSVVKPLEKNPTKANSNVGSNASCRDDKTCTCENAWAGGQQERLVYDQSTGGGGSGTFVVQSARASTVMAQSDEVQIKADESGGDQSTEYDLQVIIKDRPAYTPTDIRKQQQERVKNKEYPDSEVIYVTSNDPRIAIQCGGVCKARFAKDDLVQLQAQAQVSGRKFDGWSKDVCLNGPKGTGRTCVVKMNGAKTVEAYYK
ncbi:MAG: hypothetical protein K9K68_07660 [Methylococcaceae bacterium]|nr:hypothetical protein [Methylococcaceae bacterium]